jgi:hypothetical protein
MFGDFGGKLLGGVRKIGCPIVGLGAFVDSKQHHEKLTQDFLENMLQSKLPTRKEQRFYPREIKYPRDRYKKAGLARNSQNSTEEGK